MILILPNTFILKGIQSKIKRCLTKILFFNETEADLNKFDKIIDELEPGILRLPVLIKVHQAEC
jgi:hypothetical protein